MMDENIGNEEIELKHINKQFNPKPFMPWNRAIIIFIYNKYFCSMSLIIWLQLLTKIVHSKITQ